ncbi:hypothetical protein MASR2M15_10660 [Anaerolineales bacterium]
MDHTQTRYLSGGGCLVIFVAVILCSIVTSLTIDYACNSEIERWLPIYPGAELIQNQNDFLRPRAMGYTYQTYQTEDETQVVRDWYRETMRQVGRDSSSRAISSTRYRILENPDGPGTWIKMSSECAFN